MEKIVTHSNIVDASSVTFQVSPKKRVFSKTFELFLKDSNAYGNIYFARHFEWQGVLREAWFSECIFENMFALDGNFVTKSAHCDYKNPSFPFQKIKGFLFVSNMKQASFNLHFRFENEKTCDVVSTGSQTIVYTDKQGKIIQLPDSIKFKMLAFVA